MNVKLVFAVAVLSVSAGQVFAAERSDYAPSTHQAAAHPVTSSAVGHWVYDPQGNIIGSVRSLAEDGRTAVIMVGSYFDPGSRTATVSTGALSTVNGKVTLRTETVEALNVAAQR